MKADWQKIHTAPHDKRILIVFEDGDMAVASFRRLRQDQAVYGWLVYSKERNVIVADRPVAWSHLPSGPTKPKATRKK